MLEQQRRSVCILVVDDHEDTAQMMRRLPAREGYVVRTAGTAAEAAHLLRAGSCNLLPADIRLPDLTGQELMRQARAQYGLKAIAVSGYTSEADQASARAAGFDRFIAKPVDFHSLLRHVRELTA